MKNLITACILITCGIALAPQAEARRVQAEDVLTVDGEQHFIRADPLYRYFQRHADPDAVEAYVENFAVPNWPNYTKYWELRDGKLYLVRIVGADGGEYPLELIYPPYKGSPILAFWYSGIVSYRKDDSPTIMLNHEYYVEERVIRFLRGVEVERLEINHRDRWLSYARRIMDEFRPLADYAPAAETAAGTTNRVSVADTLTRAYRIVTHPKDGQSPYCPLIQVRFSADVENFKLSEELRDLSCYELLETIADQTGTALNVSVSNQVVIYAIDEKAAEAPDARPPPTDQPSS